MSDRPFLGDVSGNVIPYGYTYGAELREIEEFRRALLCSPTSPEDETPWNTSTTVHSGDDDFGRLAHCAGG